MSSASARRRILVTDGHELAALGAVRSLGRAGHRVTLAHPAAHPDPPAAHSRWCADRVVSPEAWREQPDFREWLAEQARSGDHDLILPISEAAVVAAASVRGQRAGAVVFLVPDDAQLKFTLSKFHAARAAREARLTIPDTVFVTDGTGTARDEDLSGLQFPVILKSDNRLTDDGAYLRGTATVARSPDAARAVLDELQGARTGILAQSMVPGGGVGAFALRWGGRTWLRFGHRRLHEVPWTGGVSSLRESLRDERLSADAERLLDHIDYEGVAMVEFRRTPDGIDHFLEINGRLWGSLALALHSGVDFPAAWVDCVSGGEPEEERRRPGYPVGLRCRNTLPGEIHHVLSVLRARPVPGGPSPPARIPRLVGSFLRTFDPWLRRDYFWPGDPGPWFRQAGKVAVELSKGAGRKVAGRRRQAQDAALLEEFAARQRSRFSAEEGFSSMPRGLLFLCYGNICRSPFAEQYWNRRLRAGRPELPEAASAGFVERTGRRTPSRFLTVTRDLGTDMSGHRSRLVDAAMLEEADAIFVMDAQNLRMLRELAPEALERTWLLGGFGADGQYTLEDPYTLGAEEARDCYRRMADSLDELARRMTG